MVHVPKAKRTKWDKKAKKMILVGFGEYTKGYRLYNPENNSVITSRDVVIMEDVSKTLEIIVTAEDSAKTATENQDSVGVSAENLEEASADGLEQDIVGDSKGTSADEAEDSSEHFDNVEDKSPEAVRRSERTPKPRPFSDYVTYMCTTKDMTKEPLTVAEALSRPDKEQWKQAMFEELQSFEENNAWELVDPPESGTIVENKWVFKGKCESEEKVRYRARLVAKGFTQRPGIDFDEIFSPVVRHSTLRLLIGLSVQLDFELQLLF